MRTPQTNGKIIDSAKIPSITRVQSYMGHEHAIPSFVTSQEAVEYIDVNMRKKHCLLHTVKHLSYPKGKFQIGVTEEEVSIIFQLEL